MAKIVTSLLFLVACLTVATLAQDRAPVPRRTFQLAPTLATLTDSEDAAGLAQTPMGYALPLMGEPIPTGSTVGIFGHRLLSSGASKVLLWSDTGMMVVEADAHRNSFPGLEMITFHLPANLHGDVWVTTLGRQASNSVKITVE